LTAVRVLFAFWFLNAMVSGDIFSDRTFWGFLMLLLLIDEHRIAQAESPTPNDPGRMVADSAGFRTPIPIQSELNRTDFGGDSIALKEDGVHDRATQSPPVPAAVST
jgi:hypothetical protein